MTESKDLVRFRVTRHMLEHHDACRLLGKTMHLSAYTSEGLRLADEFYADGFWLTCRPEQFARFIIACFDSGFQADFKDLKPELLYPDDRKVLPEVDLSGEPDFRPEIKYD